jgi:hypothetical protein
MRSRVQRHEEAACDTRDRPNNEVLQDSGVHEAAQLSVLVVLRNLFLEQHSGDKIESPSCRALSAARQLLV